MASKKEHKRKQKTKGKQGKREQRSAPAYLHPVSDINSLDLLSQIHGNLQADESQRIAAQPQSGQDAGSETVPSVPQGEDAGSEEINDNLAHSLDKPGENINVGPGENKPGENIPGQTANAGAQPEDFIVASLQEEQAAPPVRLEEFSPAQPVAPAVASSRQFASEHSASLPSYDQDEDLSAEMRAEVEQGAGYGFDDLPSIEKNVVRETATVASLSADPGESDYGPYSETSSTSVILRKPKEKKPGSLSEARRKADSLFGSPFSELAQPLPEPGSQPREDEEGTQLAVPGAAEEAPPLEVDQTYWQKEEPVLEPAPEPEETPFAEYGYQSEQPLPAEPAAAAHYEEAPESALYQPSSAGDEEIWIMPNHRTTTVLPKEKSLYIVMIAPEVAPCAKVGGLGDVVQGLGRELVSRGHGVEVIAPMYSSMRYETIEDLHEVYSELWCPHYNQWRPEKVFQGRVGGGLQCNFITGGNYTERPSIYGFDDDLYRFTYFCRQALEFMYKTNRRPDIIHCHDWTTGLVPAILWDIYQPLGWDNSRVVYTIHNNECQGLCGFGDKLLGMIGMDVKKYHRPDRMQDDVHANCINLMKAGIVFSNFTTTVSPTFAGELKTVAGGRGLQITIAKNSAKIGGVLNGLDYDEWNPQTDPKLAARYSIGDDFYEKYKNKTALREWLGLWDAWKPIVSVVTRLTQQKGLDLIKRAIFSTLESDGQFVLLGSAPDPKVNNDFLRLQNELKDNHNVNLYIGYHEDLSRLIYAGSDIFVVPSLYEPCGLTQMISLRYGTVPVVRETGGLVDTVFDLENSGRGLNDANGFTFRDPTPASLDYGLKRAIRLWCDNPAAFNRLARNGMKYNYSWKNPAKDYENIYNYIKA